MTLPYESREKSRNFELVGASPTEWWLIMSRGGPCVPGGIGLKDMNCFQAQHGIIFFKIQFMTSCCATNQLSAISAKISHHDFSIC